MKFYSEVTKSFYDSMEECQSKEDSYLAEKKEKEEKLKKLSEERKERAKEVEAAYKNYVDLLNKFIEDYKSYHVTYNSTNFPKTFFDLFFKTF